MSVVGSVRLSAAQRQAALAAKRARLVHYISRNFHDSKTNKPHPHSFIDSCLSQLKRVNLASSSLSLQTQAERLAARMRAELSIVLARNERAKAGQERLGNENSRGACNRRRGGRGRRRQRRARGA